MNEPGAPSRPAAGEVRTVDELRRWYWLREELVEIARAHGVRTSGPKLVLEDRIVAHLEGRPVDEAPMPRRTTNPQPTGPLTADTVIPTGQRSSQALRSYFVEAIGPVFRFDQPIRTFIAEGAGKTLGDAIDHWYATRDRPSEEIAPQFELNRFLRRWHDEHPAGSPSEAMAAWWQHRNSPRPLPVD